MVVRSFRPTLRAADSVVVPHARFGSVLVLRDPQGISQHEPAIPPPLIPIVARFTGEFTCEEIAADVSRELRTRVSVDVVTRLAEDLDRALFLNTPSFHRARARVEHEFSAAAVRPASHAGGAYSDDPRKLATYLDEECLARGANGASSGAPIVALIAPHIDPWRGAVGYGHAYSALAQALSPNADTFILFGTSHAPMREHFALCRKGFDTPLGVVDADLDAIDELAASAKGGRGGSAASAFDPYADEFNHKREHSLEFQAVFLKHVLGPRPVRIVPVLAGLGAHQARGSDPSKDDRANRFLDAIRDLLSRRAGRAVVIAGADMAHVGPRFGDPAKLGEEERAALEAADRASLGYAAQGDCNAFWTDVVKDLDTRRVCGLAPIYSLLRALPHGAKGALLHYEQTIDDDDGSIVSHAALGYYASDGAT